MQNDAETIEIVSGLKIKKIYNLKKFFENNSEKIKKRIINYKNLKLDEILKKIQDSLIENIKFIY